MELDAHRAFARTALRTPTRPGSRPAAGGGGTRPLLLAAVARGPAIGDDRTSELDCGANNGCGVAVPDGCRYAY